jgi:Arc/MetJ-type ribon-helix-helix transcriptional regulator
MGEMGRKRGRVRMSSIRIPEFWISLMDKQVSRGKYRSRPDVLRDAAERLIKKYNLQKVVVGEKALVKKTKPVKIPFELLETIRSNCEAGNLPFLSAEQAILFELREMFYKKSG